MTSLRVAAQQALEAMEYSGMDVGKFNRINAACAALRAALAEPWQYQRTPLTDGQIHDCFQQKHKDKVTERRMIARAIEAAHGIKDA